MRKSAVTSFNRSGFPGGAKIFGKALLGIKKKNPDCKSSSDLQERTSYMIDLMPKDELNDVADSGEILPPQPSETWCASLSNVWNSFSPPTTDLPVYSSGCQFPEYLIENEEHIIFPPVPFDETMNESPELCTFSPSPSSSSGYLSSLEIPFDDADEQVYILPPVPKTSLPVNELSNDFGNYLFLSSPLSDSAYISATQATIDSEEEPFISSPKPKCSPSTESDSCYDKENLILTNLKPVYQENGNQHTSNRGPLALKNVSDCSTSESALVNSEFKPTFIKDASGYTFGWSSKKSSKCSRTSKISPKSTKGFGLTLFSSVERLLSFNKESFIDSHCHLDLLLEKKQFQGNYADYVRENKQAFPQSYGGCVAVFCKPLLFKKFKVWTKQLTEENVYISFGCHPKDASYYNDRIEKDLVIALSHLKVRALGEIGLDYSEKSMCPQDKQKDVFRRQIKIALKKRLPLVIHCRKAYEDCLTIMKDMLPEDYPIHLHCFTDQWKIAEKYLSVFSNMCIGITNLVTFSSATEVHEVARKIPLDRLLLETDAPFFVPTALSKETSVADPGMAIFVAEKIASLKNFPLKEVLYQTRKNTIRIYDI